MFFLDIERVELGEPLASPPKKKLFVCSICLVSKNYFTR